MRNHELFLPFAQINATSICLTAGCFVAAIGLFLALKSRLYSHRPRTSPDEPLTIGPYQILQKIAESQSSTAFRCVSKSGQQVVLKCPPPERISQLRWEATVYQRIRSDYVPEYIDADLAGKTPYLTLDFIDGLPLEHLVNKWGPLPDGRCLLILRQIARALEHLHNSKIVHRDIKPANVMLAPGSSGEKIKIIDFGIARLLGEPPENSPTASVSPAFASPEAIRDPNNADPLSDIYSFGCLAYSLLSGKLPFSGQTWIEVGWKQANEAAPILNKETTVCCQPLSELVAKCMSKQPALRPGSASQLAAALDDIQPSSPWTNPDSIHWWQSEFPHRNNASQGH